MTSGRTSRSPSASVHRHRTNRAVPERVIRTAGARHRIASCRVTLHCIALHSLTLGEATTLWWLDGGGFRLDGGAMFGAVPRPRWSRLYPPADDNSVPLTAHVIVVQTAGTWGLVDSGFGHHLSDRQRRNYTLERETQLEQGLAELGLSHSSINWIVLSHLHLDHAGGVLSRDIANPDRVTPAFPRATIWVQGVEATEARDPQNRAHGMYTGDAFDYLESLGLVHEVHGEAEVVAGVRVHLTGGHSRGHQATLITATDAAAVGASSASSAESPSRVLLHLGDLLVTHAHLPPAWVSALDDFPLDSIRAKRHWLGRAAADGWWVAFSHDVTALRARLSADGKAAELQPAPQQPC